MKSVITGEVSPVGFSIKMNKSAAKDVKTDERIVL